LFKPNPSQCLTIINLGDLDFTTHVKGNKQSRIAPRNIGRKRKWSSIFKLVIEATYKNIKVLMDVMDNINSI